MITYLNLAILLLIFFCLVSSVVKRERVLWALFLIGFTQIGDIYPQLGAIRLELIVGIMGLVYLFLAADKFGYLSTQNKINRFFYLFIAVAFLSAIFAIDTSEAFNWFEFYIKRCWIMFFLVAVLIDDDKALHQFTNIIIIAVSWLAIGAAVNHISGARVIEVNGVLRVQGATGILSNPNGLANTIVQTLPFIYYLFQYTKKRLKKFLLLCLFLIAVFAVLLTGSRGGFYGLVVCVFIIACFSKKRKIAIIIACSFMAGAIIIAGPILVSRYATILNPSNLGSSGDARIWGLLHGISMFVRRPILGVGLGNYPIARGMWFGWSLWAHNHYGQLIGELGLLGIITWGGLIFYTIKGSRDIRKRIDAHYPEQQERPFLYYLALAVEIATYTRLILGMSTHSMHIFFWYLNAGLIVVCMRIIEREFGLFDDAGRK
jgi:filamentous hemagglutinin family protein